MTRQARRGIFGLAVAVAGVFPAASYAQECSPTDQAMADQSYSTAYQLVTANQWADAIPSLEMAVKSCPSHWQSLELLSQAYWRSERFEESAVSYEKLIAGQFDGKIAAVDQRILEPYGYVLLRAQKFPEAQKVMETVLSMDPANYRTHELLVHRFERSNMHEKALEHLIQMEQLQADPDEKAKLAKKIGDKYKALGNSASASEWYAQAGGSSSGLFGIGVDNMKKEKWEDAAAAFTTYIASNPDNAPALKNRGQCYQKLNRVSDARADYEKVLQLDQSRHDVASSLGFLYLDAEMFDRAAAIARDAIQTWDANDGKLGGMYYLMGKVLEKRDQKYEEAITYFERARSDAYWGGFADQEIERQQKWIEIRDQKNRQGGR